MELVPIPQVGGTLSLSEIRGGCVPEESLGSLFDDGQGCDPTWIVVWPGAFQHSWVGSDFPKMATSRETYTDKYSQELCFQCPSPTTSHIHPLFSQEVLQEMQSGLTQIPVETLLCPGTHCT